MNYDTEILLTRRPLVILAGPTAVGKTAASIGLAKAISGEIISADSMQVYKRMDIGSAKIRSDEMEGIPHHLIDILEPQEEFNVLSFQKAAKQAVQEIYAHGRIPIVTGGTGFYIQALLYDIDFTKEDPDTCRAQLEAEAERVGAHAMHEKLRLVDPESAAMIHENNQKRVIRALAFYQETGIPISQHNREQRARSSPYLFRYYVLTQAREQLYQRIELRVDQMLASGLVDEVKRLQAEGCTRDMVSMQGLGYKEILDYCNGACTLEEAVSTIKEETRHFAKRQLTWFRREKEVTWVDKDTFAQDEQKLLNWLIQDFQVKIGSRLQG